MGGGLRSFARSTPERVINPHSNHTSTGGGWSGPPAASLLLAGFALPSQGRAPTRCCQVAVTDGGCSGAPVAHLRWA